MDTVARTACPGTGLVLQTKRCCSAAQQPADCAYILFHPLLPVALCVMTYLEGISVQAIINLGSAQDPVPRA